MIPFYTKKIIMLKQYTYKTHPPNVHINPIHTKK